MNLRDKLKRLDRNNYIPRKEETNRNINNKKLTEYIKGKIINCDEGQYFQRKVKFSLDYKHGLYPLQDLTYFKDSDIFNLINRENINDNITCDYSKMIFIDTETTGLMGGTGTVAFLVGIGYFRTDAFIVEQYFMRDFAEETAMLVNLLEKINKPVLLSFNGKSFDLPLLKTRFILHRLPVVSHNLHLDLLHLSRRIWSHLDSCCLSNLEEKILNLKRKDDMPGSKIPQIYFDYLQNKNPALLPDIFKHNLLDIVSLVTLTTHLLKVHTLTDKLKLSAEELYNYGKLLQKRKDITGSIDILEKARRKTNSPLLKRKIDIKLSWQYKRAEKWRKAAIIWNDMLSRNSGGLFPYRELAKYFEHREKNYEKATNYTRQGLIYLKEHRPLFTDYKGEKKKLTYRLRRLQRKANN